MSRKVYAECNIVINPTMNAKGGAKKSAQVNMNIFSGINVGPKEPITLVIKGGNLAHIWKLMTVLHKSDEELAEKARGSALACLLDGMSVEEVAAWARENIIAELKEMEAADEDPLV